MNGKDRKIELLAPAGCREAMTAAFRAGADAVYMGGKRFGARAYAENAGDTDLLAAVDEAHLFGKSLYLTVNTLVRDGELEEMRRWLEPLYAAGLDAVIVQDMGVFAMIRQCFPGLPIHASTQMTVTGPEGARLLRDLGAVRVVPARELSVAELKRIYDATGMEVEAFVHGALCYACSGQCLLSSMIGGRSGNRGRCAQPCRLPYTAYADGKRLGGREDAYPMNLKDLCALGLLPDMLEAGVCSLKIEGRMKSPRYAAGVTSVYRKYLDRYLEHGREGWKTDPEDLRLLRALFDRGGMTDAYLRGKPGREMAALRGKPEEPRREEDRLAEIDRKYPGEAPQIGVSGRAVFRPGEESVLSLWRKGGSVTAEVRGAAVQEAKTRALTEEEAKKQLEKTGGAAYCWDCLEIELEGNCFLPVQELNRLRRDGFAALTDACLEPFRRNPVLSPEPAAPGEKIPFSEKPSRPELYAGLEDASLLPALLEQGLCDGYYLAPETLAGGAEELTRRMRSIHGAGKQVFPAIPAMLQSRAESYLLDLLRHTGEKADGFLVRTLDGLAFCRRYFPEIPLIADFSLYTYNRAACGFLERFSPKRRTLPVELSFRELEQVLTGRDELIVYGRLPLMHTANCIRRTAEGCSGKDSVLWLKDRKGARFPVKTYCAVCRNTVFNSVPLCLPDVSEEVSGLSPRAFRLLFTVEAEKEALAVTEAYAKGILHGEKVTPPQSGFTRGRYVHGVE